MGQIHVSNKILGKGKLHPSSKGALEHILNLSHNTLEIECLAHTVIYKFVEGGLRSLVVA